VSGYRASQLAAAQGALLSASGGAATVFVSAKLLGKATVLDVRDANKDGIVSFLEKLQYDLQHPSKTSPSHVTAQHSVEQAKSAFSKSPTYTAKGQTVKPSVSTLFDAYA
jgi:hypothetical protein